ncbi:MAG: methionine biosynthesis protein MetW [Xanthobacteraceae bacterium]|nr:methionine biosynthesis protein MetW [Xanthobacteraceae bacterium]
MASYEEYKAKTAGLTEYVDATMNRRFRTIVEAIPAGARVLDIACGSGTLMQSLEAKGCKIRGIDIAPGAIEHAKAKNLDAIVGDADTFESDPKIRDFMLAEYDAVIFSKSLVYLKRKNELMKALRTQTLIVNQRNPSYWRAVLKRMRGTDGGSVVEELPYIAADGRKIPQSSLRALREWGESYGYKSKVLLGNFFRSRDAVTLFYR